MAKVLRFGPAQIEDAAAIARVHITAWRATYAGMLPDTYLVQMSARQLQQHWRRILSCQDRQERVVVAAAEGGGRRKVVGFGSCGSSRFRSLPYTGEVYTLYLLPDWQGMGLGRPLLQSLFATLLRSDCTGAVIWVLSANPARYFYEALGGRRVAERQEDFSGTRLPVTAYAWPDLSGWLSTQRSDAG